jgi:hypothetical protein
MKSTDTIPAMLSPREAVLNKNAAELLGRDAIKRLNAHGNMLAKRGVDLASDPAPYPASENLAGLQMGTSDVGRDDRADLLREIDNTIYGGAPLPTPTPTPVSRRGYQYGTDSVDDYSSPFLKKKNAASRLNRPGIMNVQDDPTKPNYNPVSTSQYIDQYGSNLGAQYDQSSGRVNRLPLGATGIQGSPIPAPVSSFASSKPLSHTEMAADIARRNLTATGSLLGQPQPDSSPTQTTTNNGQVNPGVLHYLPPGFTTAVGSNGLPGSTPNDIHFLPPGFSAVSGVSGPNKQLQVPQPEQPIQQTFAQGIRNDQNSNIGYGSAYSY